jgi:hypothetical protein
VDAARERCDQTEDQDKAVDGDARRAVERVTPNAPVEEAAKRTRGCLKRDKGGMKVVRRMESVRRDITTDVRITRVESSGWIITQTESANRAPPDSPAKVRETKLYRALRMAVESEERSQIATKAPLERLDEDEEDSINARNVERCNPNT